MYSMMTTVSTAIWCMGKLLKEVYPEFSLQKEKFPPFFFPFLLYLYERMGVS